MQDKPKSNPKITRGYIDALKGFTEFYTICSDHTTSDEDREIDRLLRAIEIERMCKNGTTKFNNKED